MRSGCRALIAALLLGGVAIGGLPQRAAAEYPSKFIAWLVPFPAGGGSDQWARILSSSSIDVFGQPFHVRNVPGASGVAGWKRLLNSPADGHTIMQSSATAILSLLLEEHPPLLPDEIQVVGFISRAWSLVLAAPRRTWSDWQGFVRYARRNPRKVALGGTLANLVGAAHLFSQAGIEVVYVPYANSGKVAADFLAGRVRLVAVPVGVALKLVPEKATVVVDTGDQPLPEEARQRLGKFPDAAALGFQGLSFPRWVGVHPDTPEPIAAAISEKLGKLLQEKPVRTLIGKIGERIVWTPRKEAQAEYDKLVPAMAQTLKLID